MSTGNEHTNGAASGRGPLALLGLVAAGLVAGGWFLPLWRATLHAPQYPGGLTMHAYGNRVTGDVDEISALNHYVGMRPFDLADFPEMSLWPYVLIVALVAVAVALLVHHRLARGVALAYLWATPVGVLAVIQYRLYQYGHDLAPTAALRLDPFTPLVVGPTRVWNFTTWSWPGLGLIALLLSAAVVTVGPRLVQRLTGRLRAVGVSAALVLAVLVASQGVALAHDGHAGHDAPGAQDVHDGHDEIGSRATRVPHHPDAGTLDDLLAAARPGARVVVPPGTYRGNVVIDVPVVLEGRDLPLLVGDGTGTALTVRAPGTVIRGIAVRGSGPGPTANPAGIRVEADGVTVEQVVVEDSYIGIAVENAADVRLVDNTIRGRAGIVVVDDGHAVEHDPADGEGHGHTDAHGEDHDHAGVGSVQRSRGDGFWLHNVDHVLVRGNLVEHARDGIYVSFGSDALIDRNVVRDSRYAVHTMFAQRISVVGNHFHDNLSGAVLMYRGPALLLRNHIERSISPSTGFGVLLKDVEQVEAVQNVLVDNRVGIHLDGPAGARDPSRFIANTVARNTVGVAAYPSAPAAFRANSFADNVVQVLAQGGRLPQVAWADRGWGNYWSTYQGYESAAAGRGSVPHVEGGTVDRLLARNPELIAIADAPALRLLRAVEERWGRRDPVLVDELPITQPLSPVLPAPAPDTAGTVAGLAAGALLLLPAAVVLGTLRRRRCSSAGDTAQRTPRPVVAARP